MTITPFQQGTFNGGISEDDRIANSDQYLYGENIDAFSEPAILKLSKKFIASNTMDSFPYQFIEVNDRVTNGKKVVVFAEDKIYHADNSTAVYSDSHLGQLEYPVFVLGDYLYWVVNNGSTSAFTLDRITTSGAQSTTWSTVTVSHSTLVTNSYYEYSSVYVYGGVALITLGNKVSVFDPTAGVTDYENLTYDEIVGITGTFGSFFIFTETGKMHLWDGLSENISSTIELNIKPSRVYQYGTQVYAISGGQLSPRGLYQFNGSSFQPIFKQKYSELIDKTKGFFRVDIGAISNKRENFYFLDRGNGLNDSKVVFYGADVSGTNRGFHNIATASTLGGTFKDFRSIFVSGDDVYTGWGGDGFGVNRLSSTTLNTTGYIITNINDHQVGIIRKSFQGLYFRVRNIDATHTIKVSISTNLGSFVDIFTVNETPKDGIVRIPQRLLKEASVGVEFEDVSFKFTLTTDDNVSPEIYKGYTNYIDFNPII